MKRLLLTMATAALLITGIPHLGNASGLFDQRLSQDRQIVQALNRLTFGPRPGDVEEVRRMGVAKWIQLQLHPDQIPENPALEAKLKPLATLTMDPSELVKEYTPQPLAGMMLPTPLNNLLPPQDMNKVRTGTMEQRKAILESLSDEKRKKVLMQIPPGNLDDLPEYKKEAEEARRGGCSGAQPAVGRLVESRSGGRGDVRQSGTVHAALLAYLDPEKRQRVDSTSFLKSDFGCHAGPPAGRASASVRPGRW